MKVFLDSVGCRLNHSEIEKMARTIQSAGAALTNDPKSADMIIINTCTVTAAADSDSRSLSRRYHKENPDSQITLTGCWSTLNHHEASSLPGVRFVIPNEHKDELPQLILSSAIEPFEKEPIARIRETGLPLRTRAFVKVQDGCDHECTFCLTTLARGSSRSVPKATIVEEVNYAVQNGVQEVILTGVSLSSYGRDLNDDEDLSSLLNTLLDRTDIPRIRLSSMEPWGLVDEIIDLLSHPRICKQLHLPLQSGSQSTLRRMRRPISLHEFAQLVQRARESCPDLATTTDIIVGFPGESEAEFEESCVFVEEVEFANAHVFSYSPREGTPAVRVRSQVPSVVKKNRSAVMRDIVEASSNRYRKSFIGKNLSVLWISAQEIGPSGWKVEGVSDHSLRIRAIVDRNLWNHLSQVRISHLSNGFLEGEIQITNTPKLP